MEAISSPPELEVEAVLQPVNKLITKGKRSKINGIAVRADDFTFFSQTGLNRAGIIQAQ